MSQNCIFCKIVAGEIPSAKIYEDEHVVAFLDIGQVTEGHTLVIPKVHVTDIFDCSDEVASVIFQSIPKISRALQKTLPMEGLNLLNNNKSFAGQSVFHFHLHLIPRYSGEDGFKITWTPQNSVQGLDILAATIRSNLKL